MAGGANSGIWLPYCGAAPYPAELLTRWNFDPLLVIVLLAASLVGYRKARSIGTGTPFAAAMATLALLFVSPLCALTSALFAARAAHHAILIAVSAPLLAWSLPDWRAVQKIPLTPAAVLHAAVLWVWHTPALYAAALSHDAVYWLMQATLLGSAFAFWSAVKRASVTAAVGALLGTMVQMGLLGALITFASAPLYAPHLLTTAAWRLTPLHDQQLAGLIMWAPAAALYLAAALTIAWRWLHEEGRAAA